MKREKIRIPDGFATTARAYREFVEKNGLEDGIREALRSWEREERTLEETGRAIRRTFLKADFTEPIAAAVRQAYRELSERYGVDEADVAARSSATAEDLPEASFAGQQETFLNVTGPEELLEACRRCYASLFTDRTIAYRKEKGFDHLKVALSVGVQKMVRSDLAGSGVMFSIDPETGFREVVVINAAWGLGENVVQGAVNPDEYLVFKPLLGKKGLKPVIGRTLGTKEKKMVYARGGSRPTKNTDTPQKERGTFVLEKEEILRLARWAAVIEDHYRAPMDIEWAKDGRSGDLFIVQARPETVQSRKASSFLKSYRLQEKVERLLTGLSIGEAISAGPVSLIKDPGQIGRFEEGSILVTGMTDPDWVPIMKKAAGIVTDQGGRTCHAAIVSRELGIPAVVGTGEATT